jgi:hypothetical protein
VTALATGGGVIGATISNEMTVVVIAVVRVVADGAVVVVTVHAIETPAER